MSDLRPELWRRFLAEYVGTAFLAAVVVGSGIAAQTLSPTRAFSCSRTPPPPPQLWWH